MDKFVADLHGQPMAVRAADQSEGGRGEPPRASESGGRVRSGGSVPRTATAP